ncbi:MAG: tetratricopeptide repeat protein [Cyanobacteria bacterium J06649_4]
MGAPVGNSLEPQVVAALAVQDYKQATRLLKQWQANDPQNPLLRLYAAQLQEKTNRLEAAEKNYLKLLRETSSTKLIGQARAGIQRIHEQQKQQQQQNQAQQALEKASVLEQARTVEGGEDAAILAIAPPPEAARKAAIAAFAQLFTLDPYTARQRLPTVGFRIYRVSPWAEVSYYAQQLAQALIPTISVKATDIKQLQTFQICHFETLDAQPSVICKAANGQLGKISFDWQEVGQRVSGQLPIFEQVADIGNWGRTVHKERVLDYAQVVDLHFPGRQIVLRLCDRTYQYQQGIQLTDSRELNSRIQWNQLLSELSSALSGPHYNDFNRFSKSALEFTNLLPVIPTNLDLDRRAPSDWDLAFHLYSSLCFFK